MQQDDGKPVADPVVVLREEFDEWGLLFHPDTGDTYGLNPVGVFVWQRLDGDHTVGDIAAELAETFEEVPGDAADHVGKFVEEAASQGLVTAGAPVAEGVS
ncbi:MAG: SynChlorMet cassette protein ScmD [bacterium]|nr:SynChlorMet cassette protein ScmD [bacterium]